MEPQPFGHGNNANQCWPPRYIPASMEPQPFGHGNPPNHPVVGSQIVTASMEPQPFGHGNPLGHDDVSQVITKLQWSHSLSAMETSLAYTSPTYIGLCFNGATAFRPWKPPTKVRTTSRAYAGFNGATAFRPWKPGVHQPGGRGPEHASMEPQPFGHGNIVNLRSGNPLHPGFNGATAFRPWKPPRSEFAPSC